MFSLVLFLAGTLLHVSLVSRNSVRRFSQSVRSNEALVLLLFAIVCSRHYTWWYLIYNTPDNTMKTTSAMTAALSSQKTVPSIFHPFPKHGAHFYTTIAQCKGSLYLGTEGPSVTRRLERTTVSALVKNPREI